MDKEDVFKLIQESISLPSLPPSKNAALLQSIEIPPKPDINRHVRFSQPAV